MQPYAIVEHRLPGRARFRISSKRGDAGYFRAVIERASNHPRIEQAHANHRTGSLLLVHSQPSEPIDQLVFDLGLFILEADGAEPTRRDDDRVAITIPPKTFALGAGGLGMIQAARGNLLSTASDEFWRAYAAFRVLRLPLAAWMFVGFGIYQLIRGELFPTASALLFYALSAEHIAESGHGVSHTGQPQQQR